MIAWQLFDCLQMQLFTIGQKQKHFLLFVGFMRECVADGATKVAAKVAPSASASDLVAHHKMQVIA
jgi:hypothetical protein